MVESNPGEEGGYGFVRPSARSSTDWAPVGTGSSGWDSEREESWTNVVEWNFETGEYRTVTVYAEG